MVLRFLGWVASSWFIGLSSGFGFRVQISGFGRRIGGSETAAPVADFARV